MDILAQIACLEKTTVKAINTFTSDMKGIEEILLTGNQPELLTSIPKQDHLTDNIQQGNTNSDTENILENTLPHQKSLIAE